MELAFEGTLEESARWRSGEGHAERGNSTKKGLEV